MKLIKLIIFVLALSESECRFQILKERANDDKSARLVEQAVTTLLSCYEKDVVTLGAAGITEPILHKILEEQSIPVVWISDDTSRLAVNNRTVDKGSPHKLQLFVVEFSSEQQLHQIIIRIKNSQWWNLMATYLIIDWPSQKSQQGCSNAWKYLGTAWSVRLLNALYVCLDKPEEKVLIYSFNPYTSQAPAPWRVGNTYTFTYWFKYQGNRHHPWTTFVREVRPGELDSCRNLNFVKTHDVGGLNIFCNLLLDIKFSDVKQSDLVRAWNRNIYARYVVEALKGNLYLTVVTLRPTEGSTGQRRFIGDIPIMDDVPDLHYDLTWNAYYDILVQNYSRSSRVIHTGLAILTQHRGQMSQLDKILAVLDRSTRFGLCLVMLKTLLFFRYFMRQPLGPAILNLFRIVTNSSLVTVPTKVAPRLYLAGVFILVVTIVGIYQGKLAFLLTNPTPLPDVETMQDLIDSSHKIHGHKDYGYFFNDTKFNDRFVQHETFDCVEYVIRDPLAACVGDRLDLIEPAINRNLHLSRDTIIPMDFVYVVGKDYPLTERVNEILATFTETHIDWYVFFRDKELQLEAAAYKQNWERNRPDKVMTLRDLGFAFVILGIGLGLATVSFIVEVVIKRAGLR